jgi:hypothetical protein
VSRNDPSTPLELTHLRWRNRETRYDDGTPSKWAKVIAHLGRLDQFQYGRQPTARLTTRQQGKRLIDRQGNDTGASWWDGEDQDGLAHTPTSGTWVYDGDNRDEFEQSELAEHFSYADRWIERDDDPGHFHILIDARGVPLDKWPTQGYVTACNHLKANGFTPMPGSRHYSGATYAGVQGRIIKATPEMAAAAVRCRTEADAKRRALMPARAGARKGGKGGNGGGHDGDMAAYCLKLAHEGLDEDRIYELWTIKAAAEEDPAWPFDDNDFQRHMANVWGKVAAFKESRSFPEFTPPPAELATANGNGKAHLVLAEVFEPPAGDDDDSNSPSNEGEPDGLNVSNPMVLFRVLCHELGKGRLGGVFNRADELVYVTRYGDIGYKPADETGPTVADPPAQVRAMTAKGLQPFVAVRETCYRVINGKDGTTYSPALPPVAACEAVVNAPPEAWRGVPRMSGVTHTPIIRRDGSILSLPGHDAATGMLYLPDEGLEYRTVPDEPTVENIVWARDYLLNMIKDFPFVTDGDKANYLGALLTPAMRLVLPPPWPQLGINAPQQGSGKTLLATLLRIIYGGEEHSAPETGKQSDVDEELRKVISTILLEHTGQVVVFDNMNGVFRSGKMCKLLTGLHWSDRGLGHLKGVHAINDRLWVLTGNNLQVGGDLARRTIWVNINAKMEHPENRKVAEPDLPGWAEANRNDILLAILVLARAAMPGMEHAIKSGERRTDGYGRWDAGMRHVLAMAGLGEYGFWEQQTAIARVGADDEEWSGFLAAVHDWAGGKTFTARDLAQACVMPDPTNQWHETIPSPLGESLPGDLPEILLKNLGRPTILTRKLGKWFTNRADRWADGYMAGCTDTKYHNNVVWYVKRTQ